MLCPAPESLESSAFLSSHARTASSTWARLLSIFLAIRPHLIRIRCFITLLTLRQCHWHHLAIVFRRRLHRASIQTRLADVIRDRRSHQLRQIASLFRGTPYLRGRNPFAHVRQQMDRDPRQYYFAFCRLPSQDAPHRLGRTQGLQARHPRCPPANIPDGWRR